MKEWCQCCQPPDTNWGKGIGQDLLEDDDEVAVLITEDGKLVIDIALETGEWNHRSDGFIKEHRHYSVKANYCPMCGRKF